MIDSAVFINVGRGRQINEDDLIMVMKERLDLVAAEPRQVFRGKKKFQRLEEKAAEPTLCPTRPAEDIRSTVP